MNRLDDPAVDAIVVNYRDVTDRRLAEQALRSSEERLRHIVEHAQDLIYYCDADGRFTYVNPTAARVLQYDERELIGRHFLTLIRSDYRHAAADLYQRQLAEHTPTTYFEFPSVTKAGDSIWVGQHVQLVYDDTRVVGVHAIARDISRQKDAEDRLRKSEARYRSLVQGAAYGIYRTTVDGTILDANPALAGMLGYTVDELRALNMSAVYKSASERGALIDQYRRENNQTLTTDVTWQRKDGTSIIVRLTARVAEFEDGLSCFEGVAEDITEKRALEEQLRQALKMEAVGRLARGVAHDFNNVLAAIIGCSDLLALRLKAGDPAKEEAEEIRQAAERGAALTRQLLAFSRSQMLEARLLDLNEVVVHLESMLQRLAGERVPVSVRVSGASDARAHRTGPARTGADEPGRERPRLDARRRDHPRARRADPPRRTQRAAVSGDVGRRVRADCGHRHRRGDRPGHAAAHLRAVLHDQGTGEGHRPRTVDRLRHREGSRRDRVLLHVQERRHDVRSPAAARHQRLAPTSHSGPQPRAP